MSKKIILFGSLSKSLTNFRYPLLAAMVKSGYEVIACAPETDPEVIAKLKKINVKFQAVSINNTGVNPITDLKNLWIKRKIFKKIKPDIILSYTIKPVIYGSLAARLAGIKNIYSLVTGLGYAFTERNSKARLINKIVRTLLKIALKYNKTVFFQNPDDKDLFTDKHLLTSPEQACIVNGSGVDLNYYSRQQLPAQTSFLLISRLIKSKGIIEYVNAAKIVKEKYPHIKFQLAGWIDSNPSAIKQTLLDEWVDSGVIDFLGRLDDVRPALKECSIYVLPSYREGTPRTVLEAMATGRPVITTDTPGCRETVQDGFNGYLVPVKSIEELSQKMLLLIENSELAIKMAENSYTVAQEKYDVHKVNYEIMSKMNLV